MNAKHGEKVSFYLTPSTYKALIAAAKQDKRTLSDWCRLLVEAEMERREGK